MAKSANGSPKTHQRQKMERFLPRAREALSWAEKTANARKDAFLEPHHVLLGLVSTTGSVAESILKKAGIDDDIVMIQMNAFPDLQREPDSPIALSELTKEVLVIAVAEARRMGHPDIGTGHLLLGVIFKRSRPVDLTLSRLAIKPQKFVQEIRAQTAASHEGVHKVIARKKADSGNWWFRFTSMLYRLLRIEPLTYDAKFELTGPFPDETKPVDRLEMLNTAINSGIKSKFEKIQLFTDRGRYYFEKKDYQAAINDYTEVISLAPESSHAYAGRGSAYLNSKDYERAIADYTEAIRLAPRHHKYELLNRGLAYLYQHNVEKALEDINAVLEEDPKRAIAYSVRASVMLEITEYDKAIPDAEEALRLDPKNVVAYLVRALARIEQKNYAVAEADLLVADRLEPQSTTVRGNLGWLRLLQGDYDAALELYNEALRLDPHYGPAYYGRGSALAAKGDSAGAVADYHESLRHWKSIHSKRCERFAQEMQDYLAKWDKPSQSV